MSQYRGVTAALVLLEARGFIKDRMASVQNRSPSTNATNVQHYASCVIMLSAFLTFYSIGRNDKDCYRPRPVKQIPVQKTDFILI